MQSNIILGESQLVPLMETEECCIYQMKNESGEGIMTMYQVFPGVSISYNDYHMGFCDSTFVTNRNLLCIDHCREGRLEYLSGQGTYSYVEAGDLKLDRRISHQGHFEFPLSHYHGLMITFDMDLAAEALPKEMKDFPVNLAFLQKKYCGGEHPMIIHNAPSIEHIFSELYMVPVKIRLPYFKIKIFELLLYLDALELPQNQEEKPYFYKSQVEKIKAMQKLMTENAEKHFTQEELSERFDIPLTPMKNCFKNVYGSPINTYMRVYRMNRAAVMLKNQKDMTVTEIAGCLGYDSPSKFAVAFKAVMGKSPLEYRNTFGLNGMI
ncbi:helix-turn-helix domain-containing protein [Anaerocolumna xylanovorans]|uniref:AraC-type DNA-binding protein n=1 Tax=Anaerocolumna xylanovorans DSM 12503 TaxID=1121345 RepID=A0A1M7YM27_9FIRM|nr:AraC family transcriptional regulator [Anaerocolumna xylanovorans]SHO53650.1 AraC-type DNA-binding protein [Anaerocolumna xylanovorans DSM 12503]